MQICIPLRPVILIYACHYTYKYIVEYAKFYSGMLANASSRELLKVLIWKMLPTDNRQ